METITSFEQARDYLRSFIDFEKRGFRRHFSDVVNLETIRALLTELGDPHRRFGVVHVAGTKGKGSTAALIEAALRASGYRTGLFTSPHLLSMRERIRLQGQPVTAEQIVATVNMLVPIVERLKQRPELNPPSFFELYTAMAFVAFAQAQVEIAVIETGLGGRLDATNVVSPLVTAITTVGRDHTEILGDTLAQIAHEKAGIIKPGVPLALAAQEPEAEAVILRRAEELGARVLPAPACRLAAPPAPLAPTAAHHFYGPDEPAPGGQEVVLDSAAYGPLPVHLPLPGRHQRGNLALAWATLELLRERGYGVSPRDFAAGVAGLRWPGRFEVLESAPWLVLDCAHNVPSLRALAHTLPEALEYDRLILIFGMSADKEIAESAAEIAPLADVVILTQALMPRALWASELAKTTWHLWRPTPHVAWTTREALAQARKLAGPRDCICVTGSIFVVGEALEALGLPVR
ncbi:MAG TPA: folylpolyglutamate synthase/dihydrofolate synthase family protein [Armatimonadota bacterium]